jgi:phospho-N-acetylmuramoyl-pentapeptide-transferase
VNVIFFLISFLEQQCGLKIPVVFTYCSTRMALAAITSLLLCIMFGPRFIKKLYELKIGQPIRMEECPLLGELHKKKKDTPTMGGVLILFSMVVSMLFWMDITQAFTLILLCTTLFLGWIGGRDDYLKLKKRNTAGLSSRKKMLFQIIFTFCLAAYLLIPSVQDMIHIGGWFPPPFAREQNTVLSLQEYVTRLYIPFVKDPVFIFSGFSLILFVLFMIFVIAGSSNAVNLTDGLDGLAAGSLVLVASALGAIAFLTNNFEIASYLHILYIEGSGEIAVYLCALVGACLGFLWYNGHPAQVFMGDTGSLTLGGILGVSAVLLNREVLLAVIGGIFVAEALSVILQVGSYRLRNKKRIFLIAPLHHHFEYKGWPETKLVLRFWIIGLLCAIVGIASLKFQ